jgi:hypothetical protein
VTSTIRSLAFAVSLALGAWPPNTARSEGYLATEAQKLPDLVFGTDQAGFAVSTPNYQLVTGKAYQLTIIASGKREYAIRGDDFFNFIWLRKVEVGDVEIKATGLYEIEMEKEGKATMIFVPIRPGKYRIYAKGLDTKGAAATITVK